MADSALKEERTTHYAELFAGFLLLAFLVAIMFAGLMKMIPGMAPVAEQGASLAAPGKNNLRSITSKCPKCGSRRIRRGYDPTPWFMRLFGIRRLLCDHCNWLFTGFGILLSPRKTKRRA